MPDIPTVHELARETARLGVLREADRAEHRADRAEHRDEISRGFLELKKAIGDLSFVPREVYDAAMSRQDADMQGLRGEVASLKRVFVSGFLVVIAVSSVIGIYTG